MAKIIAVANQKGGVGKTTTAVNLCASVSDLGKKTLLADCDPQGNAGSGMGIDKNRRPNLFDVLVSGEEIRNCVVKTRHGDVIPAGRDLAAAGLELTQREKREFVLKDALLKLYMDYDYIFLDCPPSLELLTVNALTCADSVIIPMQCEYYALEGITDLVNSIKMCNKYLNKRLEVEGIVLTMFDPRMNLTNQVANEIKNYFGDKVYKTVIPRSVRLSEAPSHGEPGVIYDRIGKGSRAYRALAKEVVKRCEGAK